MESCLPTLSHVEVRTSQPRLRELSNQFNQFLAVSWHTNFGLNHQDLKRSVRQHNKAHIQGSEAQRKAGAIDDSQPKPALPL